MDSNSFLRNRYVLKFLSICQDNYSVPINSSCTVKMSACYNREKTALMKVLTISVDFVINIEHRRYFLPQNINRNSTESALEQFLYTVVFRIIKNLCILKL